MQVVTLVKDMSDIPAVKRTLEELPEDCRDIDILLNNAGVALGVAAGHEANTEVRTALVCMASLPLSVGLCNSDGCAARCLSTSRSGVHLCMSARVPDDCASASSAIT